MTAPTVPGLLVDLSSNNGHPINYAAARQAGVVAVIVKATQGTGYTNPCYAQDAAGFEAVGVPTIAYHFAGGGSPAAEAAYFVSVAGARARVLDSETSTDAGWQQAFLDALNGELHLAPGQEMDYGSASTLPRTGVRSLLWPASYGRAPGFGDCWQFTNAQTVAGIPGQVDASEWIGPPADFATLFNITPPPPPATAGPPFGKDTMEAVAISFTTDAAGRFDTTVPIPAGCTHLIGGFGAVVGYYNGPHIGFWDPAYQVQINPAVGSAVTATTAEYNVQGAVPNHFYTGYLLFA